MAMIAVTMSLNTFLGKNMYDALESLEPRHLRSRLRILCSLVFTNYKLQLWHREYTYEQARLCRKLLWR